MHQNLTIAEIGRWLRSIVKKGGMRGSSRPGVTMNAVARYTGIPRNTLKWLAFKPETACCSPVRIAQLSRLIAEVENGLIDFAKPVGWGTAKVAIVPANPRPVMRYAVQFGPRGPSLKAVPRPPAPRGRLPTMKELMGG